MKYIAACALLALSFCANAQVNKCKGSDGKVHYSDTGCAANQSGGQVKLQNNTIDTSMDWRRSERFLQQRRQQAAQEVFQQGAMNANTAGHQNQRRSPACELAIRNATTQSNSASPSKIDGDRGEARRICGFDPWPGMSMTEADAANKRSQAMERAARAREIETNERSNPAGLHGCNRSGCWDSGGNRYNRAGNSGNFFRSDGKFCTASGNTLICN